ncbi:MAG: paraquat-inducible protein A [Planctomycetota bacterium]
MDREPGSIDGRAPGAGTGAAAGREPSLWRAAGWRGRASAVAAISCAGLLLVLGMTIPVLHLRRGLSGTDFSVLTGILDLAKGGNILLALIVLAFSAAFPFAKLTILVTILVRRWRAEQRGRILGTLTFLGRWSMLDVFVIAILVGSIQLGLLAEGEARPGIFVFAGGILLSMVSTLVLAGLASRATSEETRRRIEMGRPPDWIGRGISAAAGILFFAGISLPLMTVEKWAFWDNEYSILRASWEMAEESQAFLAGTVVLFVVLLPGIRFAGLAWLLWGRPPVRAVRAILLLDEWAMLDVFGLALLVVLVKIGDIASVEPRAGIWILLAAALLSILDSWRLRRSFARE